MASQPDLRTIAGRLRWARERYALAHPEQDVASPRRAAKTFGFKMETYRKHESGERGKLGLQEHHARQYGRAYGVNWLWLMTGQGDPVKGHDFNNLEADDAALAARLLHALKGA